MPQEEPISAADALCRSSLESDAAEGYNAAEWPEEWQAGEGIEVKEL